MPLPRELQREVDNAWVSTGCSNTSKVGCVKVITVVDEIRVVQNIDERRLQLALDCFSDRNTFRQTHVDVEVTRTVQ